MLEDVCRDAEKKDDYKKFYDYMKFYEQFASAFLWDLDSLLGLAAWVQPSTICMPGSLPSTTLFTRVTFSVVAWLYITTFLLCMALGVTSRLA